MSIFSKSLRYLTIAAFTAMSAFAFAADQAEKGAVVITQSAKAEAKIVKVNKKTRELTLRNEQGDEMTMVAGKEVRNFKQIKKGDIVVVEYHRAAASSLQKVSDTEVAGEASTVQRAPEGAKPGVKVTHTSTIVATVLGIDAKERLLTVKGPKGSVVTIQVPADMTAFDSLQQGDKISALYTEAVAVSVKPAPKKKKQEPKK